MKKMSSVLSIVFGLMMLLALPAYADFPKGEPNITPEMTMKEIRENPSIQGSGIYTYSQEQENLQKRKKWENKTLDEFVNHYTSEDCSKGLNRMIENYNSGIQITYKLYTPEEIAEEPTREKVEIYYFPGSQPGGKYALIIGGNALFTSAELREGVSTAEQLNELGYTAFVLRYRIGEDAANNAPLDDVGRAVQYITQHAAEFGVQPENYALIGYSSGGQITGLFASLSDKLGYPHYGVPKPGTVMLAYSVNTFFELKEPWKLVIDPLAEDYRYFELKVSDYITPDYPPVYHWYGKNDETLMKMCTPEQGATLERALLKNKVNHKLVVYKNAPHKIGPGRYTDADGWLNDAVAFWEAQTAV